jgi:hypothetical protein
MRPPVLAVAPDSALASRPRLWAALATAYGVDVEPARRDGPPPAALASLAPGAGSWLVGSVPSVVVDPDEGGAEGADVRFEPSLGAPLGGRRLPDACAGGQAPVRRSPGDRVLATRGGAAVWTRREASGVASDATSVVPDELPLGGALRDQLRPGRAMGLLPVVDLLRRVTADDGWAWPPLRAALLFDDPNLHSSRYGYLDFAVLAAHARRHGYHAVMATVPMDSWLVSPRAARIFRGSPDQLSLLVHGVDHAERELERIDEDGAATAAIARSLMGIASLERRSGVRVGRVMVPPHHAVGPAITRALAHAGFDALCQVDGRGRGAVPELDGWGLADLAPGGLPVITRLKLPSRTDGSLGAGMDGVAPELVLNAYLGRPLVLYGHHYDAAPDLTPLAEAAAFVDGLGPVVWGPLTRLAETNYSARVEDGALRVRPGSRRLRVTVPDGVDALVVDAGSVVSGETVVLGARRGRPGEPLPAAPGEVELRLERSLPATVPGGRAGRRRAGSIVRRVASESRDRLLPLRDRLTGGPP